MPATAAHAVKVGVIGAGALGFHHTRILRDVPGARLIGFHDANPERAAKVSAELGVAALGMEALLDQVDAVSIAVPTPYHYKVAAPALERGLRSFQPNGYLSLDLGAGNGEYYRLRRGEVDFAALVANAQGPQAIESFVERIPLDAPEGEPLRLELEAFIKAAAGEAPIPV